MALLAGGAATAAAASRADAGTTGSQATGAEKCTPYNPNQNSGCDGG